VLSGTSELAGLFEDSSYRHGVPPGLLAAIAYVETRFQTRVGDEASMTGGHGLGKVYRPAADRASADC